MADTPEGAAGTTAWAAPPGVGVGDNRSAASSKVWRCSSRLRSAAGGRAASICGLALRIACKRSQWSQSVAVGEEDPAAPVVVATGCPAGRRGDAGEAATAGADWGWLEKVGGRKLALGDDTRVTREEGEVPGPAAEKATGSGLPAALVGLRPAGADGSPAAPAEEAGGANRMRSFCGVIRTVPPPVPIKEFRAVPAAPAGGAWARCARSVARRCARGTHGDVLVRAKASSSAAPRPSSIRVCASRSMLWPCST